MCVHFVALYRLCCVNQSQMCNFPVVHNKYIITTRSVARSARPLLACACISFVYLLHGRLLHARYISPTHMSKLNNKQWFKGQVCSSFTALTFSRTRNLTSLTTMYLLSPFSQSATAQKLVNMAKERPWRESSPCTTLLCAGAAPKSSYLAGYRCHR